MKSYAIYLWPCFLIALGLLIFNIFLVWLESRKIMEKLVRKIKLQ